MLWPGAGLVSCATVFAAFVTDFDVCVSKYVSDFSYAW